jgi:NADH:ubiquinone oxidoreductase subunit 6 (subunit J)
MIYFFLFILLLLSFLVIWVKNPVVSVLFLVLVFLFSILVFMLLGVEFLSLLILVVYVGAIATLFIFIIMLLNLRIVELVDIFLNYLPIGSFLGLVFFLEIFFFFKLSYFVYDQYNFFFIDYVNFLYLKSNLLLLGDVLFNYNSMFVIIAALILFVSMIGSIILTFEDHNFMKIQGQNYNFSIYVRQYISIWDKTDKKK